METLVIRTELDKAAELLRNSQLVAVPTETVYGLAGNGLDENAVREIYEVKGRPAVKPLSLMVSGIEAMDKYCEDVPQAAKRLAKRFWPGPLTIVLKAKDIVPEIVRAGGETVGLRCPNHELTLETIRLAGLPLAAPSANPSGEDSPKNAAKVMEYFDGKIAAVIDGGDCGIGIESSLIDMSKTPYKLLRTGALSEEEIAEALSEELLLIGITGGTGCGKTTALNVLEDMGALIIDADAVYHKLLRENTDMLSEIDERFPGTVVDGELQRKALGAIVFSDESELMSLNRITHKYVGEAVNKLCRDWAMNGGRLAAIDAIELFGGGLAERCTATVGVLAAAETRIQRIMARDNISREYAQMRVNAQKSDDYFIENCTYTVRNDGEKDKFTKEFSILMQEVLKNGRYEI